MTLDTFTFFEVVLSGFVTVWIFRYFNIEQFSRKYSEFEWLGLSCVWGLVNISLFTWIFKYYPDLNKLLSNPFATALIGSIFAIIIGYSGSRVVRFRLWVFLTNYFGKGGSKDKSDSIF